MRRWIAGGCVVAGLLGALTAAATDCIDVELRAEKIPADPLDRLSLFFSLANCGDAGRADIELSLEKDGALVRKLELMPVLQAGREFRHEFDLPIPAAVPAGSYRLCLAATLRAAHDTACGTVEIDAAGNVLSFAPQVPTTITARPWGSMKDAYRDR